MFTPGDEGITGKLQTVLQDLKAQQNPVQEDPSPFEEETWSQKMNKLMFFQGFSELLETHEFVCPKNIMENNTFIKDFTKFLQTNGVQFPQGPVKGFNLNKEIVPFEEKTGLREPAS